MRDEHHSKGHWIVSDSCVQLSDCKCKRLCILWSNARKNIFFNLRALKRKKPLQNVIWTRQTTKHINQLLKFNTVFSPFSLYICRMQNIQQRFFVSRQHAQQRPFIQIYIYSCVWFFFSCHVFRFLLTFLGTQNIHLLCAHIQYMRYIFFVSTS